MAGQGELPEARGRDEVVPAEAEGAPQGALSLAVVGRISGLASTLLVGETEGAPRLDASGVGPQLGLQPGHERRGVAGREAALELLHDSGRQRRARDRDPVVAEHAAEEDGEGGGKCRHPHRCKPSPHD